MGSVETLILNSASNIFEYKHISTWDKSTYKLQVGVHFLRALVLFLQTLLTKNVDLVHIHVSERGSLLRKIVLAQIAWAFQKPVIMHTHGCEFHIFYESLPTALKSVINQYFQRCSYLIVLSDSWREYYISTCNLDPNRVVVLKNPVSFPRSIPSKTSVKNITALFLGKINKRKGVYDLVKAIADLDPVVLSRVNFVLAGSGEIEQVQALAERLGVEKYLHFPGWVSSQQRDQLLAEADIFLLPSYNEGLPMALLEAMSWGLPCITTPVGGVAEIISHNETGLLVNPGSISEIKAALASLIEDPKLRAKIGSKARESIGSLDIESYSQKLFELYYSVIKEKESVTSVLVSDKTCIR